MKQWHLVHPPMPRIVMNPLHRSTSALALALLLFALPIGLTAQSFTGMTAASGSLAQVSYGQAAWGDYDQDGDLDILLTGYDEQEQYSHIYRNDGGTFTQIAAGLTPVSGSAVAWGDYDNDSDLDILLAGNAGGSRITKIYRNDAGTFNDIHVGLTGVDSCSVAWGDYDNDGDLDILLAGNEGFAHVTQVYRNVPGAFLDSEAQLPGVDLAAVAWGDADNDGDLDILLTGHDGANPVTKIYHNDQGDFTDSGASLPAVANGTAAWGDYDSDGDLDLVLAGFDGQQQLTRIYRNDSGIWTDIQAGLTGTEFSSAAWGDYDNDGDLDLILAGWMGLGMENLTRIYRNDAGTFTDIMAGLVTISYGSLAWGDYDNDRDLDILLTGDSAGMDFSRIYRNNTALSNSAPLPPNALVGAPLGETAIEFTWLPAFDNATPSSGLSYRLWVGTAVGNYDVMSPMADTVTGLRRIAAIGNLQGTTWTLRDATPNQTYFACISAVDAGLMGGPCSEMTSVIIVGREEGLDGGPLAVVAGPNPTADWIHIVVGNPADGSAQYTKRALRYALLDVSGRALPGYSGTLQGEMDLNLSELPSGMYALWLGADDCLRIIKQ
jgi:predicted nucleotidyltransferase